MAKNPPRHNLASWFVFKNVHWNWVPFEITKLDLFICSLFSNTVNENRPKHRPKSTISLLNLIQSCHSCSKNVEWTSSSYTDCWRGANLLFLVCSRLDSKTTRNVFLNGTKTLLGNHFSNSFEMRDWIATTLKQNLRFLVLPLRMWNGTECRLKLKNDVSQYFSEVPVSITLN